MSEVKDLKVGDVVSWEYCRNGDFEWRAAKLRSEKDISDFSEFPHPDAKWLHGLHESLIPEGFLLVPIEPTSEMQNAARDWSVATLGHAVGGSGSRGCYQAMIKAAPK